MTKHGKNSTANPVYSAHERKRDAKESGFGTISKRMTGDSMQKLNHCCLTNQRCTNPMVTREGYTYEKEAVIEYILKQKKVIKNRKKAYEFSELKKKNEDKKEADLKAKQFIKTEGISGKMVSKSKKKAENPPLHSLTTELPCFWLPSLAPEAEETADKPLSDTVRCPFSGKPLKVGDFVKDDPNAYVCAISGDLLTSTTSCVVIATTGDVVTQSYVNKILKTPGDSHMKCPFTGRILTGKDLINLKTGGSWHAGSAESHTAKIVTPAMLTS